MIVQGEIELVRRMGHQVSYMCGFAQDGQEWLQEREFQKFFYSRDRDVELPVTIREDWLALMQGGGNWDDVWIDPHIGRRDRIQELDAVGVDALRMPVSVKWEDTESIDYMEEKQFWSSRSSIARKNLSVAVRQLKYIGRRDRIQELDAVGVDALRMPVSVKWEDTESIDYMEEKQFWSSRSSIARKNLSVAVRQHESFNFLKSNFPEIPVLEVPDIAFMMPHFIPTERTPHYDKLKGSRELAFEEILACTSEGTLGCYAHDTESLVKIVEQLITKKAQ